MVHANNKRLVLRDEATALAAILVRSAVRRVVGKSEETNPRKKDTKTADADVHDEFNIAILQ